MTGAKNNPWGMVWSQKCAGYGHKSVQGMDTKVDKNDDDCDDAAIT